MTWPRCGELAIKQSAGKLKVDGDLRKHLTLQSFSELPVLGEHDRAFAAYDVSILPA